MHNLPYGTNNLPPLSDFVVRDTTPVKKTIDWASFSSSIQYDYELDGKNVLISSKYKPKDVDVKMYDHDINAGYVIIWV